MSKMKMGKKHKKHHKDDTDEQVADKPAALKLVLKVGAPYTPTDVTSADSQSETVDNDSDDKTKSMKRKHQSERVEHQEKKRKLDDSDNESVDDDDMENEEKHASVDAAESEESRGLRHLREKRPTFASEDEKTALQTCLEYLHKILKRKDANGFFAFPVTENIAPGYYSIITRPMDFSTMKTKIHNGDYRNVAEYKADFKLMMQNCMQYNRPDTVYHREAKRLLGVGLKYLCRDRVLQMKRNLPSMSALTSDEIGLDDEADAAAAAAISDVKGKQVKQKASVKKQSLSRFEAIPDNLAPDEVTEQAENAAKAAADKLASQAPGSKIGFLRRCEDGSTSLKILNPDNTGLVSEKERVVNLGELIGKLPAGGGSLAGLKDDRRNKINPVNYLSYDVFSSYAPIYDSSSSNLNKDDSDLLLATYGDEAGVQYAKSLQNFVANCGDYAVRMVDNLLDILTDCEHSKMNATLIQREEDRQKQQQEELRRQEGQETAVHDIAEDSQQPKSESQRLLDRVSDLISSLHHVQNARLSSQPPAHLSDVSGPSSEESELAQKVSSELVNLIKQVAPSDVVAQRTIRNALGISCEPASTVEIHQVPASVAAADADSNEFLARGTSDEPIVL